MKKEKCFAALGLALASIVTVAGAKSASAADLIIRENGNPYQLPITRQITNAYTTGNNQFTYQLTTKPNECTTVDTSSTTLPINLGTINFTIMDEPNASHVIEKTQNFSLANLKFNGTLGECVLQVTETASTNSSTYPIDQTVKYFKVVTEYVVDPTTREPISGASGYEKTVRFVTLEQDSAGNAKNMAFENIHDARSYATLTKKVRGSLADPNASFSFTVVVNNAQKQGLRYHIMVGNSIVATCTYNSATGCNVSLKHGQSALIGVADNGDYELSPNADTYSITETSSATPLTGYTTTITDAFDHTIDGTQIANQNVEPSPLDNNITFTNTNDYDGQNTGRFFTILPFVILGMVSAFAIVIFSKKKAEAKK